MHEVAVSLGALPANAVEKLSTPTIESEGYYGYPSTLDYIVDLYIKSTDDTIASYTAIVDTGSSNLAVAVDDCTDCGSGSSTLEVLYYVPEMCVEVVYGSGSWSGLMTGPVYVGMGDSDSNYGTDVYFSAITSGSSFFTSDGFQGILGLGYSGIASDYESCTESDSSELDATPYFDSLTTAGVLDENVFTMNFCDEDLQIAVGGIDSSYYTGDITYVDTQLILDSYYGYYLIEVDSINIDSNSVSDVSGMNTIGGTLVDSGTTLLYLSTAVYDDLTTAVSARSSSVDESFYQWDSCLSADEITELPSLTITSGDYSLFLLPEDYLLYYDDCYYWGVSSSSITIIGNIALQDLMVVFDKEANQIGFADAVCSTTTSETKKSKSTEEKKEKKSPQLNALPTPTSPSTSSNSLFYSISGITLLTAIFALITYFRNKTRSQYNSIPSQDEVEF
jgi:hypothetical protein